MSDFNLNFEDNFKYTAFSMHLNRSHPMEKRDKYWFPNTLFIFIIVVFVLYLLSYSLFMHDIPNGDYTEASKNTTMAIVAITFIYKYFILLHYQDSIKNLILIMNRDYEIAKDFSDEDKKIIMDYTRKGNFVSMFWLVAATATAITFVMKSVILTLYSYVNGEFKLVHIFDLSFPKFIDAHKEETSVFIMLFCLSVVFDIYATSMYIGFDPLIPIFMLHACGQLDVLSARLTKLFKEAHSSKEIEKPLTLIIIKLQDVYSFVEHLQGNFAVLYEFIMKTTTFLLPLTAFQILEDLRDKTLNLEFILFHAAVICHFFFPCYFSDLLMETSENFRQSIYSCGWEKFPEKNVRKVILFMLTKASVPLAISTVFNTICLDTFADMCRQSYAILNLMNAAWA